MPRRRRHLPRGHHVPRRWHGHVARGGRASSRRRGGSGIGRAISLRLAGDGLAVAVLYLDAAAAEAVAAEARRTGHPALAVGGVDVSEHEQVDRAMAKVCDELGPIIVLVNNVGVTGFTAFLKIIDEEWDPIMAVNVNGPPVLHPGRPARHGRAGLGADRQHLVVERPGRAAVHGPPRDLQGGTQGGGRAGPGPHVGAPDVGEPGYRGPRSFGLPEFDPFWEKVVEHDLLVGMHSSDSGYDRYANEWMGSDSKMLPFQPRRSACCRRGGLSRTRSRRWCATGLRRS